MAVLTASRALLGVVARSLAPLQHKITMPQFRVLVVLSTAGEPMRSGDLADALGVHPSTFTRTADRLVASGWVSRSVNPDNRRESLVALTPTGRRIVRQVTRRRHDEIKRILGRLDPAEREAVQEALLAFSSAAAEPTAEDLLAIGM
jgi:DNA-binding MarR family transcriptional regulator